jgi:radical SAM superfamily enzyme YgiQ (UPF0313 family)
MSEMNPRVLLVQPKTVSRFTGRRGHPPLGLMSIAAVLRENNFEVEIYDRNVSKENTKNKIDKFPPDVVGISCITGPMITDGIDVARVIRGELGDGVTLVWGGIHPTLLPEQTLGNPLVDMVVIGEGEYSFLELVQNLEGDRPLGDIRGIAFKKNGNIMVNPPRPLIDLDELPMPAWELIDVKKYMAGSREGRKGLSMHTSRGCPFRCSFCYNAKFNRGVWRGRDATLVLEEIDFLVSEYGMKGIWFIDDDFCVKLRRTYDILDGIASRGYDLNLSFFTRANYVKKELLEKLQKNRTVRIAIGVESGSPKMLELLKKDIDVEDVKRAFRLCEEYGISTTVFFMLGLPGETEEDLEQTVSLANHIPNALSMSSRYVPFPGNELYEYCVQNRLFEPPSTLQEWGIQSHTDRTTKINVSNVADEKLDRVQRMFTIKALKTIIRRGDFNALRYHLTFDNIKWGIRNIRSLLSFTSR